MPIDPWNLAACCTMLSLAAGEASSPTAPDPTPWSLSARWENDKFDGTDRYYTNGASLTLIHAGAGWLAPLADLLPWDPGRRWVGYELGQIMVTPGDTRLPVPDPEDRPYAGILYAGITLHLVRGDSYDGLTLTTGVVGPLSLAEQMQTQVHRSISTDLPQGWDYQLRHEPILNLGYAHRRRYRLAGRPLGWGLEAIPSVSCAFGNVLTQVKLGGQARLGFNLPDDFGITLVRSMSHLPPVFSGTSSGPGVFLYGGLHGSLVLRNITLDGNTWQDSPRVSRTPFVPSAECGLAFSAQRVIASFSFVFIGSEFHDQRNSSAFGVLALTWGF